MVLTAAVRVREPLSGRAVVCAVRDERDAVAAAIGDVLGRALDLPLHLVRVAAAPVVMGAAPEAMPVARRFTVADRALELDRIRDVARAGGVVGTSALTSGRLDGRMERQWHPRSGQV